MLREGAYRPGRAAWSTKSWEFPRKSVHACPFKPSGLALWKEAACFHPMLHVLMAFVAMPMLFGCTLSLVFQLAHTVEHTAFPTPEAHTGRMAHEWAVHEVKTTANFAPTNAFTRWYLGG